MHIEYEFHGDLCILHMQGRFDTGSNAPYTLARRTLRQAAVRIAVADCAEVPYVDSTGLAFLVGLHNDLAGVGGRLALAGLNGRVREVLALTRLEGLLHIFEDTDAALRAIAPAMVAAECVR